MKNSLLCCFLFLRLIPLFSQGCIITPTDQKLGFLAWKDSLSTNDLSFIKEVVESQNEKALFVIGIHRLVQFDSFVISQDNEELIGAIDSPTEVLFDASLFTHQQKNQSANYDDGLIRQIILIRLCKRLRNGKPAIFQLADNFYQNEYERDLVKYSRIRNKLSINTLLEKLQNHTENIEDIFKLTYVLKSYGKHCIPASITALENRKNWENIDPAFSIGRIRSLVDILLYNFEYLSKEDKIRILKCFNAEFEHRFIYDYRCPEQIFNEVNRLKGMINGVSEKEIADKAKVFFETTAMEIKKRKNEELEEKRKTYLESFRKPNIQDLSNTTLIQTLTELGTTDRNSIEKHAIEINKRFKNGNLKLDAQSERKIQKLCLYYLSLTSSSDIQKREIGRSQLRYLGTCTAPTLIKQLQTPDKHLRIEAGNVFISIYDEETVSMLAKKGVTLKSEKDLKYFKRILRIIRDTEFDKKKRGLVSTLSKDDINPSIEEIDKRLSKF